MVSVSHVCPKSCSFTPRCSGSQCKNVRAIKPVLSVVTPKIPTVAGVSSKDGKQFVLAPMAWRPESTGAEMILCPCRCTRKAECSRAEENGHWLWSRDKSCVAIIDANPQNMSRRAPGKVCDRWRVVLCRARRGSPYTAAGWELSEKQGNHKVPCTQDHMNPRQRDPF